MVGSLKAGLAALILTTGAASAATLQIDGSGQLTGATGVTVEGMTYDVAFLDGSCAALFSGCDEASDFAFTTAGSAEAAAQALLDQVFIDGPDGSFDSDETLTFGCEANSLSLCQAWIPFATDGSEFSFYASRNNGLSGDSVTDYGGLTTSISQDMSGSTTTVFARFTLAAVPLPAGAPILLGGLGLLGLLRRRRKASD